MPGIKVKDNRILTKHTEGLRNNVIEISLVTETRAARYFYFNDRNQKTKNFRKENVKKDYMLRRYESRLYIILIISVNRAFALI